MENQRPVFTCEEDRELDLTCRLAEIDALKDAKRNMAQGYPLRAHMWRAIAARYREAISYSPLLERNVYGLNERYEACERAVAVVDHYCVQLEGWEPVHG